MAEFNAKDHLIQLKSKNGSSDYLPVQWRLVWFRDACPNGTIETDLLHIDLDKEFSTEVSVWNPDTRRSERVMKTDRGIAIFKATIKDGKGGVATGTKSETAVSFPDFIEKAETGAIGRALAALGYGTQFTAQEFDTGERLADAPVPQPAASVDARSQQHVPKPTPTMKAIFESADRHYPGGSDALKNTVVEKYGYTGTFDDAASDALKRKMSLMIKEAVAAKKDAVE